mgnify:CR=1 FL=1
MGKIERHGIGLAVCGYEEVLFIPYEEVEDAKTCPDCLLNTGTFVRIWKQMPGVVGKASSLDGRIPQATKDLKRAAQLEAKVSSLNPSSEEYKGIKKEIKELKSTRKKGK